MVGEIPCFTLITSTLPVWSLLLMLVIDGVLLKVRALPSRPQSVIAAKKLAAFLALGVRACNMTYWALQLAS